MIGNDIEIVVAKITGGRISVGVKAPRSIGVIRVEMRKPIEQSPAQFACEGPAVSQ
jgi:carbon storage regulator CsrA